MALAQYCEDQEGRVPAGGLASSGVTDSSAVSPSSIEKGRHPLSTMQSKKRVELCLFSLYHFVSNAFIPGILKMSTKDLRQP